MYKLQTLKHSLGVRFLCESKTALPLGVRAVVDGGRESHERQPQSAGQPRLLRRPPRGPVSTVVSSVAVWGLTEAGLFYHPDSSHCSAATGRTKGEHSREFRSAHLPDSLGPAIHPRGRSQRGRCTAVPWYVLAQASAIY